MTAKTNETFAEKYQRMFEMDVKMHTEQLDNGTGFKPTYLSWSSAVLLAQTNYDGFSFEFIFNELDGTPIFYNQLTDSFFVKTAVTVDNWVTKRIMTLPILDNKFKPQGSTIKTYKVWNKRENKFIEKQIQPVNSFDVNYSQMRCLTKNISIATGIGLDLYFKEGKASALHRDQLEKEAEAEKLRLEQELKEQTEAMLKAVTEHSMYGEAKVKQWFKTKKNIDINKSKLAGYNLPTLTKIFELLEKNRIAKEEAEANKGGGAES